MRQYLFFLLIHFVLIAPLSSISQITQPEGVYSNYIMFNYEDPDFYESVEMVHRIESHLDFPTYDAIGLREVIGHRKHQDIPWAIVSDSIFYLNMRRYVMGDYYLSFKSLQKYTMFKGRKAISEEIKDKRAARGGKIVAFGAIGVVTSGVLFERLIHPDDVGYHYFLSIDDGKVYVLNKENLLKICPNDLIEKELKEADPRAVEVGKLFYFLQRINFPDEEIEKPTIIAEEDEESTDDND